MSSGVAHAEPPPTSPSPVSYAGKGTSDLGPLSWSIRLGQACWGSSGRGVDETGNDSQQNLKRRVRNRPESIDIAVTKARPWRRQARDGIYAVHLVADNRSEDRGAF